MRPWVILLFALISVVVPVRGQQPLYIINGERSDKPTDIDPEVIERIEELPADEFTIAQYGPEAANGVVLITLKYDTPARFTADTVSFTDYLAQRIEWGETDPTARIILRYRIETDGRLTVVRQLESTDNRLRRRVQKALAEAPRWEPATKAGQPVAMEGTLRLQLPIGRRMPRQIELVIR